MLVTKLKMSSKLLT